MSDKFQFSAARVNPLSRTEVAEDSGSAQKTPTSVAAAPESEFDWLKSDFAMVSINGSGLRDEMARLIRWKQQGAGTSWWGAEQDHTFETTRMRLRAAAAHWRLAAEKEARNPMRLVEQIFTPKFGCEFKQDVVSAARQELGLNDGGDNAL